jgi:hypothetical protein
MKDVDLLVTYCDKVSEKLGKRRISTCHWMSIILVILVPIQISIVIF